MTQDVKIALKYALVGCNCGLGPRLCDYCRQGILATEVRRQALVIESLTKRIPHADGCDFDIDEWCTCGLLTGGVS